MVLRRISRRRRSLSAFFRGSKGEARKAEVVEVAEAAEEAAEAAEATRALARAMVINYGYHRSAFCGPYGPDALSAVIVRPRIP